MQGNQLRQKVHSTILTMLVGPYKEEALFVFKRYQPPDPKKKRPPSGDAGGESPKTSPRATTTKSFLATNKRQLKTQVNSSTTYQLQHHRKEKQSSSQQQPTHQQSFSTRAQSSLTQHSRTNSPFYAAEVRTKAKHARTLRHITFSISPKI